MVAGDYCAEGNNGDDGSGTVQSRGKPDYSEYTISRALDNVRTTIPDGLKEGITVSPQGA